MTFNVWIPLLAKQDLHSGAGGFGLLMAASGVGSLIGALALAFLVTSVKRWMLYSTAGALGALDIVLALVGAIPLAIGIAMLGGSHRLLLNNDDGDGEHDCPDERPRRAARARHERLHDRLRRHSAVRALIAGAIASSRTPVSLLVGIVTVAAVVCRLLISSAAAAGSSGADG